MTTVGTYPYYAHQFRDRIDEAEMELVVLSQPPVPDAADRDRLVNMASAALEALRRAWEQVEEAELDAYLAAREDDDA